MMPSKYKIISLACLTLFLFGLVLPPLLAADNSSVEQTSRLQQELDAIQKEIDKYEQQLTGVRSEKNSLTKKINQLKIQQSQIKLQIQQSNLTIMDIGAKLLAIQDDLKAKEERAALLASQIAELLRTINQKDHYSWLEILISEKTVGNFFARLNEYDQLIDSLNVTVADLQTEKKLIEEHQLALTEKREDQKNLLNINTLQNQKLSQNITDRRELLTETKNQESNYQAILADKKKRAQEIKARIYDLLGISQEITFGEAVKIAQWAESQTGVRTAFLLAILTQESNLGRNVGTCNRPGDPPEKSWKEVMKPERDQEPFLTITKELGMNPDVTPVSCPMKDKDGNRIGWGGAMGPAQFIPSTWLKYRGQVSAVTGKSANPWDIRDAFLAAAILLKASGAGSQAGEWAAAMRYFSGSTNARYRFYGDNVIAIAEKYQEDIEALE